MYDHLISGLIPTRVVASYRLLASPVGVATRQKGRLYWGILLKLKGRTVYQQNGKTVVCDFAHPVIAPKGSAYDWTCEEPGECIVIDFDATTQGEELCSIEVSDNSSVLSAFLEIERSLSMGDPIGQLEAMQQLYGLLAFLLKPADKLYIPKDKRTTLTPAVEYITSNYSDGAINNDMLAELCGMSTVYFRKCFKAVYGVSPIHYLNQLRINKAKAILSGDYESVGQVADSIGYSSVYHFSKMFKQYTGRSPSEFANKR